MPLFKSKPKIIDAVQFKDVKRPTRGVFFCVDQPMVKTIQGIDIPVRLGEWIVDEGDGIHFYPIADEVFKGPKGYDPVD